MGNYVKLHQLQFSAGISYTAILDFKIDHVGNDYARAFISIICESKETERLFTGVDGTDVRIVTEKGDILFSGYITGIHTSDYAGELCTTCIDMVSYVGKMDIEKKERNFQNPGSLSALAQLIASEQEAYIFVSQDIPLTGTEHQRNETNWEFLLRISAREGQNVFSERVKDIPYLYIGGNIGEIKLPEDAVVLSESVDVSEANYVSMNVNPDVEPYFFRRKTMASDDIFVMPGQKMGNEAVWENHVHVKEDRFLENVFVTGYSKTMQVPYELSKESKKMESKVLVGEVLEVEGTNVKVKFSTEDAQDKNAAVWMPYETTMSNYFYAMPDEGDHVVCYYEDGGNGVCFGSLHVNTDTNDMADPGSKLLMSQDAMIRFIEQAIEFLVGRSVYEEGGSCYTQIVLDKESGIAVYSDQDIVIDAKTDGNSISFEVKDSEGDGSFSIMAAEGITFTVGQNSIVINPDRLDILADSFSWEGRVKSSGYEQLHDEMEDWFSVGLDILQLGLDIVGALPIPGVSTAADLINAGISAARGDWAGCALSLLGAIPIVGTAATAGKLGKAGVKAAKAVKTVGNVVKSSAKMTKALKYTKVIAKTVVLAVSAVGAIQDETELVKKIASGEFDITNAEDAELLVKGLRGVFTLRTVAKEAGGLKKDYENLKTSKKSASPDTPEPKADTPKQKQTNNDSKSNSKKKEKHEYDPSRKKDRKGKRQKRRAAQQARKENQVCKNDPIDVVTGSLSIEHTDMVVKYTGGIFEVTRRYESVYLNEQNYLGCKWLSCFDEYLVKEGNYAYVVLEGLHEEQFIFRNGRFENSREGDESIRLFEIEDGYILEHVQEHVTRTFNQDGNLVRYEDKNRNGYTIIYTEDDLIERVCFTGGNTLSFAWENDRISSITDMIGRKITYLYDENGYLVKVGTVDGAEIRYDYTLTGEIRNITDQNGNTYVTNEYDRKGRVVKQITATGEETVIFYDEVKRENTFLNINTGEKIICTYDGRKLPLKEIYTDGTYTEKRYDRWENIIYERDRIGNATIREYDECGNLLYEKNASGLESHFVYDEHGNCIKETDQMGTEIIRSYDERGNLNRIKERVDEARYAETSYERDEHGRIVKCIDPMGNVTESIYGRRFAEAELLKDGERNEFRFIYDDCGRMTESESFSGKRYYGHDNYDHVTMEEDEEGNVTRCFYDRLGNPTKIMSPKACEANDEPDIRMCYDAMDNLIRITEVTGKVKEITRDCFGRKISETGKKENQFVRYEYASMDDTEPSKTIYPDGTIEYREYDAAGNVTRFVGAREYEKYGKEAKGITYEYDSQGNLAQITENDGHVSYHAEYDLKGNLLHLISDEEGEKRYRYNLAGWCVEERKLLSGKSEDVNSKWSLVTYEHDLNGNVIKECRYTEEQDRDGQNGRMLIISSEYDGCERLIGESDGLGAKTTYGYDPTGRMTFMKHYDHEELLKETYYFYDKAGKVTRQAERGRGIEKPRITLYRYDINGNLISKKTPLGHEIIYGYDRLGRLLKETHKGADGMTGNETVYTYDTFGNIMFEDSSSDGERRRVSYETDVKGNLSRIISPDGSEKRITYDADGQISRIERPGKSIYGYTYDDRGKLLSVISPLGYPVKTYAYDESGRKIQERDGLGNGADYIRDAAGRLIGVRTSANSSQSFTYSAMGQIKAVTDGNGAKTELELDAWGRTTKIGMADGSEENYTYDAAGRIRTATDGNGNTVRYGYDGFGQMIERTDALGNTDLYEYDVEGNRVSHVDRNGVRTKMTYNMYHDIMSVSSEGKKLASYGYTGDGLLKYGISGGMRYDYSYDSMGRLTGKTAGGRKLVSYTYDEAGNRDSMTDVTGKKTEYVYDPEGKLIKVRENGKVLAEYEYDRAGRKIKTKLGEVLTQTVSYTSDSQIKRMRSLLGTEILVDECYAYDPNGNVLERTGLTGRIKYGYDKRNRLTWIEGSNERGEFTEKLTYDHAGNRISRETISRGRTACEILEQYSYDNGNRLLELKRLERNLEYLEGFESTEHFSYDKQGNMLSDGQFVYDYDEQNRLVRATGKAGSEAENRSQINRYDAEGLRAEMEENGRLVRYIYSDREVATEEDEEGEIIRYVRGLGIVASDTEKARTYYHYKESAASDSDENESRRKGENASDIPCYHYYELDAQDSTRLIVDEKGIENSYEYDAFGKIIEATEHVSNRFTYTGQQYDAVTQQYYLRARFYNPVIGRFLQEDTYLGDGLNLYAYCQNNPLVYYDPTGHDCGKKTNSFNSSEGGSVSVNPNEIRFSQSSVNGSEEIIASMKKNGWNGSPIDIVEMPDGVYTTIDNTRVVSARQAGINVEANIHSYNEVLPSEYIERFTTKKGVPTTWGEAIELRVGKQKASFRNGNPFGSFEMENIN